jgi:phage replication O-like protein O
MISAPNHTQTPNICFDEIFKTLKEGELRVILVLIRQTFGWHKPFDRISLSQLAEKSGMERKSVCRSLNSLIQKNLVRKTKIGEVGRERCYYMLVTEKVENETRKEDDGIESAEEIQLISNILYQCPKDTPPVSYGHPPSVFRTPTKETNTKETNTKEQQQASPVSAAVFSDSKNKEQQQPKYYPCLESVNIPLEVKVDISTSYDLPTVLHALEWLKHYKKPLSKPLAAVLRWACKNRPDIDKPKEPKKMALDIAAFNRDYFRQINTIARENNINLHYEGLREATNEYLQTQNDRIYFKDKGFLEQVANYLRKKSIQCETLFKMIELCQKDWAKQQ